MTEDLNELRAKTAAIDEALSAALCSAQLTHDASDIRQIRGTLAADGFDICRRLNTQEQS